MKIAVVFGGKSGEHTISVATGIQAYDALRIKHDVVPIYVDRDGVWRWGKPNVRPTLKRMKRGKQVAFFCGKPYFYVSGRKRKIDCVLLCLHGKNGEDGCAQGVLRMAGIPFSGCDVAASAVGMDKKLTKNVLAAHDLPQVPFFSVEKEDYDRRLDETKQKMLEFGLPLIVKPANAGSSIGITVVKTEQEIDRALRLAFSYDSCAVIERLLEGFTEVNCAVLKTGENILVSDVEQPGKKGEFLAYRDKYAFGTKLSLHQVPAHIDEKTTNTVKDYAFRVFRALGCAGVARVDFMIDAVGKVYVNEINTIPGSLAFYLFVTARLSPERLCDRLVEDALYEQKKRESCRTKYEGELWSSK